MGLGPEQSYISHAKYVRISFQKHVSGKKLTIQTSHLPHPESLTEPVCLRQHHRCCRVPVAVAVPQWHCNTPSATAAVPLISDWLRPCQARVLAHTVAVTLACHNQTNIIYHANSPARTNNISSITTRSWRIPFMTIIPAMTDIICTHFHFNCSCNQPYNQQDHFYTHHFSQDHVTSSSMIDIMII